VQGISVVAGVSSINGLVGDLTGFVTETSAQTLTNKTLTDPKLTLISGAEIGAAGFGILYEAPSTGSIDLNTVVAPGFYRLQGTLENAPPGVQTQIIVARGGGDTILQIITGYHDGEIYWRHGNPPDVGGTGSWSPWYRFFHSGNLRDTDNLRDNIVLNAFRIAENNGLTVQGMIDGVTDTYTDDSGIDKTKSSENIAAINGSLQTIPPWDVSTATYASKSFGVGTQDTNPMGVFFKSDGTAMYVIGCANGAVVYQYTLSTAWDVSTATYASKSFSVAAQEAIPTEVFFKPDGTAMYVVGYNTDTVYQYTLSTAWNYTAVSTAVAALSQPSSSYIALQEEDVDIITINTDLRAFISRDGGTTFTQATLAEVVDLGVQRILTATVDLTAQPAGTSMVYKIIASGDKKLLVHATSLQWN
jgi:hypothetical protein